MRADRRGPRPGGRKGGRRGPPPPEIERPPRPDQPTDLDWDQPILRPPASLDAPRRATRDPGGPTIQEEPEAGTDTEPAAGPDPGARSVDQVALQRGLLRVAEAASRNNKALELLTERLEQLDGRLLAHEGPAPDLSRPEVHQLGHQVAVAAERTVALDERLTLLEQLRHEVEFANRRTGDLENRVAAVELRDSDLSGSAGWKALEGPNPVDTESKLFDRPERRPNRWAVATDDRLATIERRLRSLEEHGQRAAAAVETRLGALSERVARLESAPTAAESRTTERLEQLTKELRSLEERIIVVEALPVTPDNGAEERLQQAAARLLSEPSEGNGASERAEPEPAADEPEMPDAEVERLCRSLRQLMGDEAADAPEALTAELHRIRRSVDLLPRAGEDD